MTLARDAIGRFLVSAVVVGILSIQAVASFVDTGRWGWPLLAYPMYKTAHFDGERLDYDVSVYAVLSDGTRAEVRRDDLGMDFWLFWYNVVTPIEHDRLDLLKPVIARFCERYDGKVVGLRVEDKGVAIGRDGPVRGLPPQLLSETAVACP